MTPRDTFLAVTAALIWGATFPFSASALAETPPLAFTFLRFLCAAAFAVVIPKPDLPWSRLILLGCLLGIGQYGLMFLAMSQGLPAGMAAVLVHTQAIFTVAIAMALLNERPNLRILTTLALAGAGLTCLLIDRAQAGALIGFVLVIAAALSAACGNIVLKSAGPVDMTRVAVWMSFAPLLPLLALSLIFESGGSLAGLFAGTTWVTLAAVLYSAALATVTAYGIWGRLLVRYDTGQVAPFFLLVPVFGLTLSALFLNEALSALQLVGSALILAGLTLTVRQRR
jgi:O-acetylserine/cysteine efflux transporter